MIGNMGVMLLKIKLPSNFAIHFVKLLRWSVLWQDRWRRRYSPACTLFSSRFDVICALYEYTHSQIESILMWYIIKEKDLELEKITNEDLKAFCYLLGDHKVLK